MTTAPTMTRTSDPTTSRLRVLIADKFDQSGRDRLAELGYEVTFEPDLAAGDLADAMTRFDPEVLVVRSTKVPAEVFDAGKKLSLVVRAGAGYDSIDVAAASRSGVSIANCPGKNALAVAELTWALILGCDRRIPDQTGDLRAGKWDKKGYAKARGLHGRTLGVIGLGPIGAAVVSRGLAFGMKVCAWSRSLTDERADELGVARCASPVEVAQRADVVSVHVASNADTKHLVNDELCDALRPGAILVNTTRGAVVDEAALLRAIREKGVRAGLDVYEKEPAGGGDAFTPEIVREPGVVGTHHVGASTDQAQEAIAAETIRIISCYATTGEVPNCVNRAASSPATCLLTVRHLNRPGVLAHVFRVLSEAELNVEEMENVIYDGAAAACARIQLDARPTAGQLDAISGNEHILSVNLAEKPAHG